MGIIITIIGSFCVYICMLFAVAADLNNDRQEAVYQLVTINKNFHDSERKISSYDEAVNYKIISDSALKNNFIKENVKFDFSNDAMTMSVQKDEFQICQQVVNKLGTLSKSGNLVIMVNGKPIKDVINSESNIDYACSQNDSTLIKNELK